MNKPFPKPDPEIRKSSKLEAVLAYLAVFCIAASVIAYLATLILAMVLGRAALTENGLQNIAFVGYVGLPVGFVIVVVLLIRNMCARSSRHKK